jgi:hypothetical protein
MAKWSAPLVRYELALLVLLVGAFPAAGFAVVSRGVQEAQAAEQWLKVANQRTLARVDHARARALGPGYLAASGLRLMDATTLAQPSMPSAPYSYLSVAGNMPQHVDNRRACDRPVASGQGLVRGVLDWTWFSPDRAGDTEVRACAGSNELRFVANDGTLAGLVSPQPRGGVSQVADVGLERWALAAAILGGAIAAAYWAKRRLLPPCVIGDARLEHILGPMLPEGDHAIMLIGPPRTSDDLFTEFSAHAWPSVPEDDRPKRMEINLLDKTIDEPFITARLDEVQARQMRVVGSKVENRFAMHGSMAANFSNVQLDQLTAAQMETAGTEVENRLVIHVSNLAAQLIDQEKRSAVIQFLERLLAREADAPAKVVLVTTSIDPVANFHEIFDTERKAIRSDDMAEVELSRSSLLLSRFRRRYLPIRPMRHDPWWDFHDVSWRRTLAWEACDFPPLVEAADALKQEVKAAQKAGASRTSRTSATNLSSPANADDGSSVRRADLARAFCSKALACYDLLWASCTRCEKIVLVQLAQEGFVTTGNWEVVQGLIYKGLIVERPNPMIFNHTFRSFLRHIEDDQVVAEWERGDGNGLWVVAGRLIGSSLIAGGLFYLVTQDFSVDSLLPVVSGTGIFGMPVVRALFARVTTRGAAAVMAA